MNDAADLPDLLAEAGIKLKSLRPGHSEKVRCPKCDGGRTREASLSVSIDADGNGAKWKCHRGQCGWMGGGRVRGPDGHRRMAPAQRQQDQAIVRPQEHQQKAKPKALYAFFAARGISEDTVDHFGVYIAPHWFPETGPHPAKEYPAIVFPYRYRGELVNRKYRPPHKNPQMQDRNALPTLFNIDALKDCPDDGWVVWVEGEPDVMALHEAGWPYGVTLKDGAPATLRDEDDIQRQDDKRFRALETHEEELQRFHRIVLAVDDDVPGRNLREELARRLGRHRCYTVEWPTGCKDAGDVLRQHGRDRLTECIGRAEPWPIEGVQRIKPGMLQALRREPPPPVLTTGTKATDGIMRLPGEGKLIVVTGVPGHGKAMALDTPVPTPTGWTTMGDIQTGDEVFAADGSVVKVTMAHPVVVDRPCMEVVLSDGSKFTCDEEHLWFTRCDRARRSAFVAKKKRGDRDFTMPQGTDQRHKRTYPSAKTTRQIADTLTIEPEGRANHAVSVAAPLVGTVPWPGPIPPYVLGAWLGDGTSASAGFTSPDVEVIDNIRAHGFEVRKSSDQYGWYIQNLKGLLREMNQINNKHIPKDCLRSPVEARLALLQGLMDSDGHARQSGDVEFSTSRQGLAHSVFELVASLGMKPTLRIGRAMLRGKDCGEKYRVFFTPTLPVFRLSRKAAIKRVGRTTGYRYIKAVHSVPSVPVRCITVDHPSSLYLVGRAMVPTHNTTWVRYVMVHTAINHGRRWLCFSPENAPWQRFLAECAEVFTGRPFNRRRVEGEWVEPMTDDELAHAEEWLSPRIEMLAADSLDVSPTLEWVLDRAKTCVMRNGTTDLLIDPWNELEHMRPEKMSETEYVGWALHLLRAFNVRHGINTWVIAHPKVQLAPKVGGKLLAPGLYDISGGANWANKSDLGISVHTPESDTEIHLIKSKFRRWGIRGTKATIQFDKIANRYYSPATLLDLVERDETGGPDR